MTALSRYLSTARRADLLTSPLVPNGMRIEGLRRLGMTIGAGVSVESGVRFLGADVVIGDGAFINRDCFIDRGPVRIGAGAGLAPGVMLASGTHAVGPSSRRWAENVWGTVTIGEGCWIGARSIVMPGVTVARGCIVGAGSIVTKDTEPDGVYVGTPARRIRDLPHD